MKGKSLGPAAVSLEDQIYLFSLLSIHSNNFIICIFSLFLKLPWVIPERNADLYIKKSFKKPSSTSPYNAVVVSTRALMHPYPF